MEDLPILLLTFINYCVFLAFFAQKLVWNFPGGTFVAQQIEVSETEFVYLDSTISIIADI